jgi:Na+/H+-dicarboxylate symporter
VEGNVLQIAVESIFIGVCLLALGDRSTHIKRLIIELNDLTFKMMYAFSKLLPALVGLSVFETLSTTDASGLATIGEIAAANIIIVALLCAATLVWLRASLNVPASVFLRKTWPALLINLATGSSSSSMGEFFRISRERLGIADAIVDFWVPLGHAMFVPSTIVPLVVGMFAVANIHGVAFGASRIANTVHPRLRAVHRDTEGTRRHRGHLHDTSDPAGASP